MTDNIRQLLNEERLAAVHEAIVEEREGRNSPHRQAARQRWQKAFDALTDAREKVFAKPAKNWDDIVERAECLRASLLWTDDKPACSTPGEVEFDDYGWRAVHELLTAILTMAGRTVEMRPDEMATYRMASKLIEVGPVGEPDLYQTYLGTVGLTDESREVAHV